MVILSLTGQDKAPFHFLIIMLGISEAGLSHDYFRVKAGFSVKTSKSNGTKSLTRGTVYHYKNIKELIYAIIFPMEEIWLSKDTSIYKYSGDTLMQRVTIPAINEFTVFPLSLLDCEQLCSACLANKIFIYNLELCNNSEL